MQKELIKELQRAQEKMQAMDILATCIEKCATAHIDDIAELIHKVYEADYIDTTLSREIQHYQILSSKDILEQ